MRDPTMSDIAKHLGVSRQLVSIVMRDMPGASDETRERVRKAAAELGYQPHQGARMLRQYRSRQLGVAFNPANARESDFVEALYDAVRERDLQLVLSAHTRSRSMEQTLEELLGYRCAAIVAIGLEFDDAATSAFIERYSMPIVAIEPDLGVVSCDVVRSAGDDAMRGMVAMLVASGHKRICYVDTPTMPAAQLRRAGYVEGIRDAGLEPDIVTVVDGYTEPAGAEAGTRLLRRSSMPTAAIASNDQVAVGLLTSVSRAGVRVPGELSIAGYDDSRYASLACNDLTTQRVDPDIVIDAVLGAVLRRIESPGAEPEVREVAAELVVRGSTAPPRG